MSPHLLFAPAEEKQGWNGFLISLTRAELAAAEQCDTIAARMDALARPRVAELYHAIGREEREHVQRVQELCRHASFVPVRAEAAYQGQLLSDNPSLVERMAVFHLAFETSALSFLGYLCPRVEDHFRDKGWARQIGETFTTILRQEVSHISQGKAAVLELLERANRATRQAVARSLRRHYAFLRVGLKSFFRGMEEHPFVQEMIRNYRKHYEHAIAGVV